MALLLYEKGRVQLKTERFSDALVLFLEADDELKTCQSNLIQSVDNIALLNLDIVWCYLNLKSIMQLPDAEVRLKVCEDNFKRSYGENLSRVQSVKGSSENERSLIARLHLMFGILYFHQNRRNEAKVMFDIAEREIQELKVDEVSVAMLMDMGYSKAEAVTGLRSSFNSIDGAVNFILDRRQKFSASRKEGKKERDAEKLVNNLGFSANPRSVVTLHDMGFPQELCALALQKCKDDIEQALNLLQNNQNELKVELAKTIKPNEKYIQQLISLGFDKSIAENMLKINANNFQQALDAMLEMGKDPNLPHQMMSMIDALKDVTGEASSSSTAGTSASSSIQSVTNKLKAQAEKAQAEQTAFGELSNDLDHLNDDDEYLTNTLEKEAALLKQYRNALGN